MLTMLSQNFHFGINKEYLSICLSSLMFISAKPFPNCCLLRSASSRLDTIKILNTWSVSSLKYHAMTRKTFHSFKWLAMKLTTC